MTLLNIKYKLSRKRNENMRCVKNSKNSRINGCRFQQDWTFCWRQDTRRIALKQIGGGGYCVGHMNLGLWTCFW